MTFQTLTTIELDTSFLVYQLESGGSIIATEKKAFLDGLCVTERQINDIIFLCQTRIKPTYFTRATTCKMDFRSLILFQLNLVKKTLQLELDAFSDIVNGGEKRITKQGYSLARQKISPEAFIMMADEIVRWYYGDDNFKKFRGYRLSAIDASILQLPNSERLRSAYGYSEGGTPFKLARAKAAGVYDLENDMMLTSIIGKYTTSERDLAIELIEKLKQLGLKNDLILFDRGYPGKNFFNYLETAGVKYVIRLSNMRDKQIKSAQESDQIIDYVVDQNTPLKMRVVRFNLDSGEEEVLATNLLDDDLSLNEFKELYFRRWGIETKFDELKNRLQIQNFTGDTVVSVEQDFYASIYLSNMAALAKREANEEITQRNKDKGLKYDYKVNVNILIGKLKDRLILMLLEEDPEKRKTKYRKIMQEISQNVVPIRPGRQNPRKKGLRAVKYPHNQKGTL